MELAFETVAVSTGELTVARQGRGQPVVLIPNYGRAALDFSDLAARLVSADYEIVAINPRGSNMKPGANPPTLHDLGNDIAEVMDVLQIGPAHVIGHAFGNRIARCMAADSPHLVRSLVLLAAGGKYPPEATAFETARRFLEGELPGAMRLGDDERAAAVQYVWFTPRTDGRVWTEGWDPLQIMLFTAAAMATPLDDWWGGGSAPMLVIQGLQDRIAPPENGRDLRDRYPDRVSLVEIPEAAHALLPEEPDLIASTITRFLAAIDGGKRGL
jgi:pimeloyl-ACP methyl ester carboxylesterase